MDKKVKNFNTRLRTIQIWELALAAILSFIATEVLAVIFPAIDMNDDLFMIALLVFILLFFIWCLKDTEGLSKDIGEVKLKENRNEILYVFILNIIFAYLFLFSVATLDMIFGMDDPTWVSIMDIDSVNLTPGALIFSTIASIIFAPILEELIFRGVLFNRLKIRIGIIPAMIISSFLFSIGHDFGGIVSAFLFGLCMCILYLKTDNILITRTVHFMNNITAALIDITPFDSIVTTFPWIILLGIIVLAGTVLLIKYIISETKTLKQKFS